MSPDKIGAFTFTFSEVRMEFRARAVHGTLTAMLSMRGNGEPQADHRGVVALMPSGIRFERRLVDVPFCRRVIDRALMVRALLRASVVQAER